MSIKSSQVTGTSTVCWTICSLYEHIYRRSFPLLNLLPSWQESNCDVDIFMAGLPIRWNKLSCHFIGVIMSAMATQITNLMIVYSIVYSAAVQRKHQSSASLAFVRGIHCDVDIFMAGLPIRWNKLSCHFIGVIMSAMATQITNLMIVYSIVYSAAVQRKHQSSASLAFVRGIHCWPVNSLHKGPVTWKTFPFDDVIISWCRQGE